MTTFTDDFNRADTGASGGWGANWTTYQEGSATSSGFQILTNKAHIVTSFTLRSAKWNGGSVGADQFSQATMSAGSVDFGEYVAVRKADGNNFYAAGRLNDVTVRLVKYVAGVQTTLDTQTVSTVNGDVFKLTVSGTTLNFYVNGVLKIGPITDSSLASGQPGLRSINTTDWEDWSGGDLSATTGTATPTTGAVTIAGNQPSINPFTNVRIREVLINEAGSPVANQTGIHLVVWYGSIPTGAPDLSYSNMTTDPNGTTSWSLATGTLVYNQRIFYVAHDGHASLSVYTCAQMMPTYS
jgi:hypothetical protein